MKPCKECEEQARLLGMSAECYLLRAENAKLKALMRQALDALEDAKEYVEAELNHRKDLYKGYSALAYKYASEQASLDLINNAIAALKEIPK